MPRWGVFPHFDAYPALLAGSTCVRMMDATEGVTIPVESGDTASKPTTFAELLSRPTVEGFNGNWYAAGSGLHPDDQIALCNVVSADCYICIPYLFNADEAIKMARYYVDRVNRRVIVEFANEVFHTGFCAYHELHGDWIANSIHAAEIIAQVVEAVPEARCTFGCWTLAQSPDGSQQVGIWGLENRILPAVPELADAVESLAIAPYIAGDSIDEVRADIDHVRTIVRRWKRQADDMGLELICYESGLERMPLELANSAEMGIVFSEYLTMLSDEGVTLNNNYNLISTGADAWGCYQEQGKRLELTPRVAALARMNRNE